MVKAPAARGRALTDAPAAEVSEYELESYDVEVDDVDEAEPTPSISDMQQLLFELYFKLGEVETTLTEEGVQRDREVAMSNFKELAGFKTAINQFERD